MCGIWKIFVILTSWAIYIELFFSKDKLNSQELFGEQSFFFSFSPIFPPLTLLSLFVTLSHGVDSLGMDVITKFRDRRRRQHLHVMFSSLSIIYYPAAASVHRGSYLYYLQWSILNKFQRVFRRTGQSEPHTIHSACHKRPSTPIGRSRDLGRRLLPWLTNVLWTLIMERTYTTGRWSDFIHIKPAEGNKVSMCVSVCVCDCYSSYTSLVKYWQNNSGSLPAPTDTSFAIPRLPVVSLDDCHIKKSHKHLLLISNGD